MEALLKKLTETFGPSGETAVRTLIEAEIKESVDRTLYR